MQMWRLLSKYTNTYATSETSGESFANYYSKLALEPMAENFDMDNENEIKEFILAYDNKIISEPVLNKTDYETSTCNVTTDERENAIDASKNNKAHRILEAKNNVIIEDICNYAKLHYWNGNISWLGGRRYPYIYPQSWCEVRPK